MKGHDIEIDVARWLLRSRALGLLVICQSVVWIDFASECEEKADEADLMKHLKHSIAAARVPTMADSVARKRRRGAGLSGVVALTRLIARASSLHLLMAERPDAPLPPKKRIGHSKEMRM